MARPESPPPAEAGSDAEAGPAALDAELVRINRELAAQGIRLRLERRGGSLGLRGPLPASDGNARLQVQRLSLGLPAHGDGLLQARTQLEQVQRELETGAFRWTRWRRRDSSGPSGKARQSGPGSRSAESRARAGARSAGSQPLPPASPGGTASTGVDPGSDRLAESLASFEAAFFADPRRRRHPAGSRSTWVAAYRPYLRRLERLAAGEILSADVLERTLESYGLASRSRQQCGLALAALARHQGIALPADWGDRCSGYGLHRARFRQLPSDGQILSLVSEIPSPGWRLVYGLMATYGLRNHEVFFCDFSGLAPGGDRVLRVLPTSKTGEHQVWPFQPDWVERFGLTQLGERSNPLPPVCTDLRRTTLQQVGRRVSEQFHRYALPLTPYDLRHAWAVRTIHIGLPDTVAARMMGHSVAIHTRTYHHWITRRDQQQAVDAALARLRSA